MPGPRPAAEPRLLARRQQDRLPGASRAAAPTSTPTTSTTKTIANLTDDDSFDFAPDLLARRPVALLLLGPRDAGQDLPDSAGRRRLARADHLRRLERRGRGALPGRQAALLHLRPRRRHLQHLLDQPRERARRSSTPTSSAAASRPTVLHRPDSTERLVFSAYYKRRFTLYVADSKKPYRKLADLNPAPSPAGPSPRSAVPAGDRGLDRPGEDPAEARAASSSSRTRRSWPGSTPTRRSSRTRVLIFGDNLGDRRLSPRSVGLLVHDFRQFQFSTTLKRRLQKGIQALRLPHLLPRVRQRHRARSCGPRSPYRFTGGDIFVRYPLNRYYRLEGSVGFLSRRYDGYPVWVDTGGQGSGSSSRRRTTSRRSAARLVGDTTESTVLRPDLGPQRSRSA